MASHSVRWILAALALKLSQGQSTPSWLGSSSSPCPCIFEGTTLPAAAANASGNPLYGTSCQAGWDGLPGTRYYKNDSAGYPMGAVNDTDYRHTCPEGSECSKSCNFLHLQWCYVDKACAQANNLPGDDTTLDGAGDLFFSYAACGNPYCWNDYNAWADECPYVQVASNTSGEVLNQCHDNTCRCKYEGTVLPEQAAAVAGNPLYGTSCENNWDSWAGTRYHKNATYSYNPDYIVCPMDKACEKGCNYLHLKWCYVEPGCQGAMHYQTQLEGAGTDLRYSYEVCGNPYCWNDFDGWTPGCPGGDMCSNMMTCSDAKSAYREAGCCGMPAKNVQMVSSR